MAKFRKCKIVTCESGVVVSPTRTMMAKTTKGTVAIWYCNQCGRVHDANGLAFGENDEALYFINGRVENLRASVARASWQDVEQIARAAHIPLRYKPDGVVDILGRLFNQGGGDPYAETAAMWVNRGMKGTTVLRCPICHGVIDETRHLPPPQGTLYSQGFACGICGRVYNLCGLDGDEPRPDFSRDEEQAALYVGKSIISADTYTYAYQLGVNAPWGTLEAWFQLIGFPVTRTVNREGEVVRTVRKRRFGNTDAARRRAIKLFNDLIACRV